MENNVIETNKNKNLIIGVMACIIVLLIAALVYFIFIKKDKPEEPVKPQDNQQVNAGEVKHVTLGETNEEILINNKKVNLKVVDSTLYINDVVKPDVMLEGNIFVTDKYALIAGVGQFGYGIDYAIDENANVIKVYKSVVADSPYSTCQVNNIRNENGKVVAEYYHDSCNYTDRDDKECESKVEFVYDGKNVIITDVSLPQGIKALTKIELDDTNSLINFNGKQIRLKTLAGSIYYNDKLIKTFEDMNNFGVYVSEKTILIYWIGSQCNPVFIGAINENGEFVEVVNPNGDYVYGLYTKDGVIMGTGNVCQTEPDESKKYNAKFVYDGKKVKLIKEN